MINNFTHISLCTGIGGFDEAAESTGFTNIANCEINAKCRTYLKNRFPNAKQYTNVITDPPQEKNPFVLSFGFPCQDISIANQGKKTKGLEGERSKIFFNCMDVVRKIKPRYIIIENSPELLKRGMGVVLQHLSETGYDAEWMYLSGSQFGFPQKRTRLFIVAHAMCGRCLHTILQPPGTFKIQREWIPTETYLRVSTGRANRFRDITAICRGAIVPFNNFWLHGFGNCVMPVCAEHVFECIKHHFSLCKK